MGFACVWHLSHTRLRWWRCHIANLPYAQVKGSGHNRYGGHSSHVTNVRFTPDGRHLISTGGFDKAVRAVLSCYRAIVLSCYRATFVMSR